MAAHFDTLETRDSGGARARAYLAALPRRSATPRRMRRPTRACSQGVDPAADHFARRAGAPSRSCASRELLELQKAVAAVRRICRQRLGRTAHGRARACSRRPGRSTSPRVAAPTTGASRARCSPRDFAPAIWCTTAFPITSRRRGCDARDRRARARLHRVSRRDGADRAAGAGDGRARRRRLCRHAVVPEDHPRQGRRAGRRAAATAQGAGLGRSLSGQPCATR